MSFWRKVVTIAQQPAAWALGLECGHVAFRSLQYSRQELPGKVLCNGCNFLIGSRVKKPSGTIGKVSGYSGGLFDVAWNDTDLTRWTLDDLREKLELI